jgi:methionyl-tRNA formyltransferase
LNLVFAGTPEFARAFLLEVLNRGEHSVAGVFTQPDRPAGRGKKLQASAVKLCAEEFGVPVFQPENLRTQEARDLLIKLQPDLLIVVAYGLILPQEVIQIPRFGCINVHASLLPRWRGAAPIQRAIEAGDEKSGVCIMRMDAGLDTGDVLDSTEVSIADSDTAGALQDKLIAAGKPLLMSTLKQIPQIFDRAQPQNDSAATYANKIRASEGALDWALSAQELDRKIRAFDPVPGTYSYLHGSRIKILCAQKIDCAGSPGTIMQLSESAIDVACGSGGLRLTRLQLPGKKSADVAEILRGNSRLFQAGALFTADAST